MGGTRVLVIDDSTTLHKVVEIAMRGTGCTVELTTTGSAGVARARAQRPDVILLDYMLPDLRSSEVCERLRSDEATARVPVVIMSANPRDVLDDFRTFPAVAGFIRKPFTAAEIRARLTGALASSGPGHASQPIASAVERSPRTLELRGDLAVTPLLEVLRLLAATQCTGTLVVEDAATARISVRRGEILMCTPSTVAWGALGGALGDALTPALSERVTRNLAVGKPVLVSLAEAGVVQVTNLPLELHAASVQLIGEWLDARTGRFSWEPATTLPDFVEAFGRQVSLTALALDHARRAGARAPERDVLDQVYDRTPRFSAKLAGAQLTPEEQRVLGLLDGRAVVRELVGRTRLPAERVATIVARLCAADLIHADQASRVAATRTLAVLDADREHFIGALRSRLGRRAQPIEVVELDAARPLAAAVRAAGADVVLVGATAATAQVLEHELPELARGGAVAVVGVLEAPDPTLAGQLLRAGLHAVIAKPVHLSELERLLAL